VAGGSFVKLQILVPGETAAPGTASGKTGTPATQTAGSAFNITVNAVDANWNVNTNPVDVVQISSSGPNPVLPSNTALSSGTAVLSVTFRTATSAGWTLTASDFSDNTKTANTSASVPVVAGVFTQLQLLVPGESASAGSASGKTGTPSAQTAGAAFNSTVNAVDANWNVVTNVSDLVSLASSDTAATLPGNTALVSGTVTLGVTLKTAGTSTLAASDFSNPSKTASMSPSITVNPGVLARL
jgi:hypothetical protein